MPIPRSFKTDESFLEKIAIGATGTRQTFADLARQGHKPLELERGSQSYKIWKAIKIKRIRLPDIVCLQCAHRIESRAKTALEITMSHSTASAERGWDYGLADEDRVALVHCRRSGPRPVDWEAGALVQYIRVGDLRESWRAGQVKTERPKGAQEGFETRVTWPAAIASAPGVVDKITHDVIRYRKISDGRVVTIHLSRAGGRLQPLVAAGEQVMPDQILAAVVPASTTWPCPRSANLPVYLQLATSTALSDRYTAVKALGRFAERDATAVLVQRVQDEQEHVYVRMDAAAGLMRRMHPTGREFLSTALYDPYLEHRLEAVIVLSEVATLSAVELLTATLQDAEQHPEIRAGAAWSIGEIGAVGALPTLITSFNALEVGIKIEAARALTKLAGTHKSTLVRLFPESTPQERPGIAWALSKAAGIALDQLLPARVDADARHWIAYIIGTQDPAEILPQIELLTGSDPEIYFAVMVLWKIIASWVYDLEEY